MGSCMMLVVAGGMEVACQFPRAHTYPGKPQTYTTRVERINYFKVLQPPTSRAAAWRRWWWWGQRGMHTDLQVQSHTQAHPTLPRYTHTPCSQTNCHKRHEQLHGVRRAGQTTVWKPAQKK